jgi:hypothetical protein
MGESVGEKKGVSDGVVEMTGEVIGISGVCGEIVANGVCCRLEFTGKSVMHPEKIENITPIPMNNESVTLFEDI